MFNNGLRFVIAKARKIASVEERKLLVPSLAKGGFNFKAVPVTGL
jgi:hypothetical protein